MTDSAPNRRRILQAGGLAAAALTPAGIRAAQAPTTQPARKIPFRLGLPTYMFKHYDLDQTLAMARRVDVKHICLRNNLVPMDATDERIAAAITKVKQAGCVPYAGGVIYMRTEAQVTRAFEYAKAAGFGLITINIRPELLGLLDKKVRATGIRAAIHNHGPEDKHYPTPQAVLEKIRTLDRRIGICHDTGHTQRAGVDPVAATIATAERTLDVHLKDVDAATKKGRSTELGRGVVDLPGILRALAKFGYAGVVGIEVETHMQDLLPGLAESVGYVRGALAGMGAGR